MTLWWLCLCLLATFARAQSTSAATAQYLWMQWAGTDIVRVTFAEPLLKDAMKTYFEASDVSVIDIREPSFPTDLEAATRSTFHLLFMITRDPGIVTTAANDTQTGDFQPDALAAFLQNSLPSLQTPTDPSLNAIGSSSNSGGTTASATVNQTATSLVSFFPASSVSFEIVSTADAQALGPFPALAPVGLPSSPAAESFMLLHVFFRNIPAPANLTQGMIYQTRQGVSRFLRLPSIADIYAAGPPEVPANTVLQVEQVYYLALRGKYQNLTLAARETLANLLLYGDPAREINDFEHNNGFFATTRASMFLDYIMPAQAQASPSERSSFSSSSSGDATTTLEISMMEALFAYAFSSITIDQFPPGNPPASAPATPSTVIPGVSIDVLASKMCKRQRFLYNATTFASGSASSQFPSSVTYPSSTTVIQANATSSCTMVSGFCTYIYWKNSVSSTFWLESMESVNRVAWNLFPSTPFFAVSDPSPMTLAPIISPGNTSTPIWTFGALSGPSSRLDFALNLRNVDDNSTSLKVEVSTDVRSPVEATSTITSIARDTSATKSSSSSPVSVYETKSNIVVTYQSRFRNSNEMFLFLEIKNSTVQAKDTSQPCAHCQNLYEWCASQPKCVALASCVFLQGIDRDQIPYQMLQSSPLQDVRELWPYFQNCMNPDSVDLKAIMLLSNAVRCQMQRLCTFRTSSYYGSGSDSDNKILIWESVEGIHRLTTSPTNSHFSRDAAVNVSMRLGDQVLCYLPIFSNATADDLAGKITRTCRLAKYLGRVSVSVNMTGSNASTSVAGSYDTIDIRYKYLVGPLPKLEVVQPISSSSAVPVQIVIVAFPGIRLRLETQGFQTILPPVPSITMPDPCVRCSNLALNVCLRDLKCVAFTDCIMRYPMNDPSVSPLGDVILDAFQNEAIGEQVSLSSAIDACHSNLNVNQPEWRKLVNASACFSNYSCPISMQMLVPSAANLVGKWRISPEQKVQKLIYQQQSGSLVPDLRIPLELVRDSEIVKTDSSSVANPRELELKLQRLLEYDDISVEVEFDRIDSTSGLRTIQWSIAYNHWMGSLPRFISDANSPMWTLFTYPSPQQDLYLEVLNKTALASNDTLADSSGSNLGSIPV